jgi:hypothetical protein
MTMLLADRTFPPGALAKSAPTTIGKTLKFHFHKSSSSQQNGQQPHSQAGTFFGRKGHQSGMGAFAAGDPVSTNAIRLLFSTRFILSVVSGRGRSVFEQSRLQTYSKLSAV